MILKRCEMCGKMFSGDGNARYCSREHSMEANKVAKQKYKNNLKNVIKRKNKSELAEINESARSVHMSYGQYVAKMGL